MFKLSKTKTFIPSYALLVLGSVSILACSSDKLSSPEEPYEPPPVPDLHVGEIRVIALDTYDGSGEVVHPDVMYDPHPLAMAAASEDNTDKPYIMAITPYPGGNATHENPSIFFGSSPLVWREPAPKTNPIAKPNTGHLSDPDIIYNPEADEIWVYYREANLKNQIFLLKSRDGKKWSTPSLVVETNSHNLLSPAVVRRGKNDWLMWTVNGGASGCSGAEAFAELRRSSDGISWGAPKRVSMNLGNNVPWHVEVQWIPSYKQYWAVYNAKSSGGCATPVLYFATSSDGITWTTFPTPLLRKNDIDEFKDIVYRSTFQLDESTGMITFWYSGAKYHSGKYIWRSAVQKISVSSLMLLNKEPTTSHSVRKNAILFDSPPLTNETAP